MTETGSGEGVAEKDISRFFAAIEEDQAKTTVDIDELKKSVPRLVEAKSEEESETIVRNIERLLGRVYRPLRNYAATHGNIISFPNEGNMLHVARTISKRGQSLRNHIAEGGQEAVELTKGKIANLIEKFNTNLVLTREAAQAYKQVTIDKITIESLERNVRTDPMIISHIKGWLYKLIYDSHPDFRRLAINTLVEYRRGLGLSMDKGRDDYDVWTQILSDIKRKDSRSSYAFGYAKILFERASINRTDLEHHPTQFSHTINTLGSLLTELSEGIYASAVEFGVKAANLRSSELTDALGSNERAIVSRDDTRRIMTLEEGILTNYEDLVFDAIRGTSLEGKIEYDGFEAPLPKGERDDYLAARTRTFASDGPVAALHKDIAYLASTPDIKDRARIGQDMVNTGFRGAYMELSGKGVIEALVPGERKGPYEELEDLRKRGGVNHFGFTTDIMPYPGFDELQEAINGVIRNPNHETVSRAHSLASRLFEALDAYRLYGDIVELSMAKPSLASDEEPSQEELSECRETRRALATQIKMKIGEIYRKLGAIEAEINTPDRETSFSYTPKREIFETIDAFVGEPHAEKVGILNSQVARLYEVLRLGDILLNSRRRTKALVEEYGAENKIIIMDKTGLNMCVKNVADPLRSLVRREFIAHKKYLEQKRGRDTVEPGTDDALFEAAKFDMLDDNLMIGYAARLYKADLHLFKDIIDGSSEAITKLEEFGRKLLRVYGAVSSLAKALYLNPKIDDSKALELLAKYRSGDNPGRIGTVFDFVGGRMSELEGFLRLETEVLGQVGQLIPQLLNAMSAAEYFEYPQNESVLRKAEELSSQGDYGGALKYLDIIIIRAPDHPWVAFKRGKALLKQGDIAGAVGSFELGLENNPNTKTAYACAYALAKRGDPEKGDLDRAKKLARTALEMDKHNQDAENLLEALEGSPGEGGGEGYKGDEAVHATATDLLKTGHVDEAIARYDEIIVHNPDFAWAHYDRGIAYLRKKDYRESTASLRRATELKPNDPNIRSDLAGVYEKLGNVKEARAQAEKALELDPKNRDAKSLLETLERRISAHQDIYDIHEDDDAIHTAGSELLANGDFDGAIRHYDAIIARAPDALAHYDKSHALLRKGDYKEAIDSFRKAAQLKPGTSWIHSDLAIAYEKLGLPKAAKSQAELTLQLDPNDEAAKGVLERISE